MLYQILALYLGLGVVAGTTAGLFGIGGGLIIVPIMHLSLKMLKVPNELIMHLSVGTSLATIFFTGMSSTLTHYRLGSIDWKIYKQMLPGIMVGTFLGAQVAGMVSSAVLEKIFMVYVVIVTIKMWVDSHRDLVHRDTKGILYSFFGLLIGFKSPLLGIGGGTISIPFLNWRGLEMKKAVGISAALGLPIALIGTSSAVYHGYGLSGLPEYSLGYVYLPGLVGISSMSLLFARLGAHLSHRLPQKKMQRGFAIMLMLIAAKTFFA